MAHQTLGSISVLKFFCRSESFENEHVNGYRPSRHSSRKLNYVISISIISYRRFHFSSLHSSRNVKNKVILRNGVLAGQATQAAFQRRLTQNGMDNSHRLMLQRMSVDTHKMETALQLRLMREDKF
jgi:hypothetical protein